MGSGRKPMTASSLGVWVGCDYTEDELEFLKAIERYKREARRPFPTWKEVLEVLKSLGYEKVQHG